MRKVLFWLLFAVTMAVYGTMLGWSLPTISAAMALRTRSSS
jgi:hypothetical protein